MDNNIPPIDYIRDLYDKGILPGVDICKCGNKHIKIQKINSKNIIFVFNAKKM